MARFQIRVTEREASDPRSSVALSCVPGAPVLGDAALSCIEQPLISSSSPALSCLDVEAIVSGQAPDRDPKSHAPLAPLSE